MAEYPDVVIIPVIKRGLTLLTHEVYLILLSKEGISGVSLGRLFSKGEILIGVFLFLAGVVIGQQTLNKGTDRGILGAIIGSSWAAAHMDEVFREKVKTLTKEELKVKLKDRPDLLISKSKIKEIRLRITPDELVILKVKAGLRWKTFLLRRKYIKMVMHVLAQLLEKDAD